MATHTITMPGTCRAVIPSDCRPAHELRRGVLSRREFLDGAGFTALAGIAAAALASPDVTLRRRPARRAEPELVRLARAYEARTGELTALIGRHGAVHGDPELSRTTAEEQVALLDKRFDLAEEMVDLVAITPAELAAKAAVVRDQLGYIGEPDPEDALVWSLLGDLLRGAAT